MIDIGDFYIMEEGICDAFGWGPPPFESEEERKWYEITSEGYNGSIAYTVYRKDQPEQFVERFGSLQNAKTFANCLKQHNDALRADSTGLSDGG